jgi:DNA polymerase-3 subunit delta
MPASPYKPVYVLYGDDDYLRDEHRRKIVAEVVGEADPQLAVASFDADVELAEVLDSLRTLPLMTPSRLVIVRDADEFVSKHRQALEDYLRRPSPTGALLLMTGSWPSTTNLAKMVAKIGQAISCSAASAGNLSRWLAQAAQKRGKKLDAEASRLLEQFVGEHLAALDAEVEKLSLYVGQRHVITAQDVSLLTVATAETAPFALVNAIAASNVKEALTVLDKTLTRRGLEFQVLGQIAWYLRSAAKGSSYRPGRPPARIQADFRRVLAADLAMKSGGEPRATMQDLVLAMCL